MHATSLWSSRPLTVFDLNPYPCPQAKDFSVVNLRLLPLSHDQASAYLKAHGCASSAHAQRREQTDNLTLHRLTMEGTYHSIFLIEACGRYHLLRDRTGR